MIDDIELKELYDRMHDCDICPRNCRQDRYSATDGICGMPVKLRIASYGPHYGEEPELVGYSASGTIFFSGCNLLCKFCQNYDISHFRQGTDVSEEELATIMLKLQSSGVENINLVTPSHYAPQIIKALFFAKEYGLKIPVVYNSSGYDKVEILKKMDGLIDIYMPDIKFVEKDKGRKMAAAPTYFEYASKALVEMHRQVGDLLIESGVAKKGLLVRHLVLPNDMSDTKKIIDFIADRIGTDTYLNLMDQYHPAHRACEIAGLDQSVSGDEFKEYVNYAKEKGFTRPDYLYG